MAEQFKIEKGEYGNLVTTCVLALVQFVFGLLFYVYSHETADLKEQLKAYDARLARLEQAVSDRSERIRGLETSALGTTHDLDKIGHSIDNLDQKMDRLIEQGVHQPHTSFSHL